MNQELINKLQQYQNMGYVFTSCNFEWIVVLIKTNGIISDESRDDIVDNKRAKFNGNRFMIYDIVNKFDMNQKCDPKMIGKGIYNRSYYLTFVPAFYDHLHFIIDVIKFNGAFVVWYDNGTLKISCDYVNGTKNGKYLQWYDNGTLWIKCRYINDKEYGEYQLWNKNGTLYIECEYVDGKYHGKFVKWYDNGQMSINMCYNNGKPHGKFQHWYEDGTLCMEVNYVYGKENGKYVKWYPNGTKLECEYINGKKIGNFKEWYPHGQNSVCDFRKKYTGRIKLISPFTSDMIGRELEFIHK